MLPPSSVASRWIVTIGWVFLATLLAVLLWHAWQGPDVFYHLALGREVVESRSFQPTDRVLLPQPSYRNIYWLFQVAIHAVWTVAGINGVSLLFLLLWFAIFVLWQRVAGVHRNPAIGLPLSLVVVLVLQPRFDLRPEVLSYLLLIACISRLARWRPDLDESAPTLAFFALTEALWVNLHGYFVLGPVVVASRLIAAIASREGRDSVRRLAGLLAMTAAATLASPFGTGAWRFVAALAVFLRDMRGEIAEFGPPTGAFLALWTVRLFWVLWALTPLAGAWLLRRRRLQPFSALLAGIGLGLSATAIRSLPLLPLLAAPLWRDAMAEASQAVRRQSTGREACFPTVVSLITAGVSLVLAALVVTGGFYDSLRSETRFGVRLPPHAYPVRAARYLETHGAHGRMFNSAAEGGYLELQFPEIRVCMDSRYVEATVVRRYFAALIDPAAFHELDANLRFDAALLKVVDSGRLAVALLRDPGWELVWGDLHRALWVRRESPLAGQWPEQGLHLNLGDDLSERANGLAAIQWTAIAVEAKDRRLLVEVLDQLALSPRIPSFVVQYALQYGLAARDDEVLDRGRDMVPRMLALAPEHALAVDRLLDAADRPTPR